MNHAVALYYGLNDPTISVVMPVYNGAETIAESLDSIFEQTLQPDEIIVVDDGSTDNTLEILAGYGDAIKVMKTKNKGHASARNTGMGRAFGEFIAILDADDIWVRDKLATQVEVCADADVVYTAAQNFGECAHVDSRTFADGICVTGDHLCPLLLDNFITHSSVLLRREAALSVGGYDASFRTAPDWDLWLRMAQENMRFHGIPEPQTLYRWVANSTSKDHTRTCKDRLRAITNAIERSDPQRVSSTVCKKALGNAWGTSAWFAASDQPRNAIIWFLHALRLQPTTGKLWTALLRTAFRASGLSGS